MQYLSKAYNYYSGINPATLSGAIDVIVVRHVDENGEETLSSSPFHVRFGKLQVLRAGEKRVTLRLPNNLPPPHVAPFSMKVGEAGEAFFVLETEEDVPEELMTSPVVMATDATDLPPSPSASDEDFLHRPPRPSPDDERDQHPPSTVTLTQQPFGATEQVVEHAPPGDKLGEVEPLDLNAIADSQDDDSAADKDETKWAVSPSSLFDTATSLLPSIPFLSTPASSKSASTTRATTPDREEEHEGGESALDDSADQDKPYVSTTSQLPNPLEAQPGEDTRLPTRDHRLENIGRHESSEDLGGPEGKLPKVRPGEGEGPDVVYGKDIVLDMGGYHEMGNAADERENEATYGVMKKVEAVRRRSGSEQPATGPARSSHSRGPSVDQHDLHGIDSTLVDGFVNDLMASAAPSAGPLLARPSMPERQTDPLLTAAGIDSAVDTPPSSGSTDTDVPAAIQALSLDSTTEIDNPRISPTRRRFERGLSEPPVSSAKRKLKPFPTTNGSSLAPSAAISMSASSTTEAAMDYAWDWYQPAPDSESKSSLGLAGAEPPTPVTPTRSSTIPLPPVDADAGEGTSIVAAPGKLKNVEEDPYRFVLEVEGSGSHTFELSLCGREGFASDGTASVEEEEAFFKSRITFQHFIEDPNVVDDPRLVIRYSLLHLTWTNCYRLLLALALYRRSLMPPILASPSTILPPLADVIDPAAPPRPSSGYGWSRWWRRNNNVETEPPQPRRQSAQPLFSEKEREVVAAVLDADRPASPPPEPAAGKHYAKTLRLSSDQLEQLQLKPGPNTVQFSVTSSYSGLAVCTARIFLWDETDQVVISDIDGTITKSDALGHVFAAIGRDWTHIGIAKLYTDICNNGYKILYLTSRAIGQADTTREYLRTINQGDYRMPEGPVIMSPDRLMASLHREVIMRKPELFKMACLRDIQRLFGGHAKEAFYAGFGNRITDAMSYRSVGIPASKIYTIDSTGVVKTELLQAVGHKGSYMGLNDLVNEVFPPVTTMFKPEFTDFNYWRPAIADIPLPDLSPPSPALSARSDESGRSRLSMLGKITGIARRTSRQPLTDDASDAASRRERDQSRSRPSSPLVRPVRDDSDDSDYDEHEHDTPRTRQSSMPGSFDDRGDGFPNEWARRPGAASWGEVRDSRESGVERHGQAQAQGADGFDDEAIFDDDILAAGEMARVPF
ncbi:lipin Ned1 [Cryptotrichosporon argae]